MKKIIFTLILCVGFSALAQHHAHTDHGFLLLGEKQLHAYHIARFNSPHEYQILLELELKDSVGASLDIAQIKKDSGSELISLLSEDHFAVADLNSAKPITQFKVKLFGGYLRDRVNRKLIVENISLTVKKINYFKKIAKDETPLSFKKMILTCDQGTNQFYLANMIQGVNSAGINFEEIILGTPYIELTGKTLPCTENIQGSVVDIEQGVSAAINEPFKIVFDLGIKFTNNETYQLYVNTTMLQDDKAVNN